MAIEEPIQISASDQAELQHLADLMHLFHHRNKSQHRRSIWWRHFSVFRKQLRSLVVDNSRLNEVATTNLARTKKKVQDAQILATTAQRITFWRDILVTKWQHAFSQLISDGRFSVLGLVLLASLSQVCQVVGITADLEDLGQAEVEKVLIEFGREARGSSANQDQQATKEDLGEIIQRDKDTALVKDETTTKTITKMTTNSQPSQLAAEQAFAGSMDLTPAKKRTSASKDKNIKKRRKKGNAIDDIFGYRHTNRGL